MAESRGSRGRIAVALLWTAVATGLFLGFGLAAGRAVTRTLLAIGAIEAETEPLLLRFLLIGIGALLLGVSTVYRRTAGGENAGSLAASFAGWALILYQGAMVVARVSRPLAVVWLVAILTAWAGWQFRRRYRDRGRTG